MKGMVMKQRATEKGNSCGNTTFQGTIHMELYTINDTQVRDLHFTIAL